MRQTTDAVEDPVLQARGEEALGLDMIDMAVDRHPGEEFTADISELQPDSKEDSTGNALYISRYFQGTLLVGTGNIAKTLAAQFTPEQQCQAATDLFNFLQEEFGDLRDLNGDSRPFTALVAIPGAHRIHVLYGLSARSSGIGQVSLL